MFFQYQVRQALQVAALTLLLALTACGGSGSSSIVSGGSSSSSGGPGGDSNTDCSQPKASDVDGCGFIALSDAPGDFLTYVVKVDKLTLTRRDGTVADVLSGSTSVDFTRYADLSEFLSLSAVPAGNYVSGTITLDYTGADIEAQDSSGNAVKLTPVDSSGKPLGTQEVVITLDSNHPFGLFAGAPHVLDLDFNLDASNVVNLSSGTVTVHPFLVATVDPSSAQQQVRGPLGNVDTTNGKFTLALRPFRATSGDFGTVPVYVNSKTTYLIDQKVYVGSSGLNALKSAGAATAVLAQGSFNAGNHHFLASFVFAGSSVVGGTKDAAEGVVTARSGNTLTLRGVAWDRSGHTEAFEDQISVTLSSGTVVRQADMPRNGDSIGDISVGQHLLAFGTASGSGSSTKLDASNGFVLLELTRVDGAVLSISTSSSTDATVTMDTDAIEGQPIGLFDFTGTGSDPSNYGIKLPCSCLTAGVGVNDMVRITGLASSFGTAPPDFEGQALADYEDSNAVITMVWSGSGTANAFTSLDASTGLVLNLSSSPKIHQLREGGAATDLNTLSAAPTIKGQSSGTYAILRNGQVQLYTSFSSFVSALQSQLSGGAKVRGIFSTGGFDDAGVDLMTATSIAVSLQ